MSGSYQRASLEAIQFKVCSKATSVVQYISNTLHLINHSTGRRLCLHELSDTRTISLTLGERDCPVIRRSHFNPSNSCDSCQSVLDQNTETVCSLIVGCVTPDCSITKMSKMKTPSSQCREQWKQLGSCSVSAISHPTTHPFLEEARLYMSTVITERVERFDPGYLICFLPCLGTFMRKQTAVFRPRLPVTSKGSRANTWPVDGRSGDLPATAGLTDGDGSWLTVTAQSQVSPYWQNSIKCGGPETRLWLRMKALIRWETERGDGHQRSFSMEFCLSFFYLLCCFI